MKNTLLLTAPLLLLASPSLQARDPLPNIVYILTDDLGYGDVSCLNPESKISTPHIDRLAAQGMIFSDAHSNSAVCSPTRYGIMTGRYAWRSRLREGVLWGFSPPLIPEDRMTVASLMKQTGYQTAAIGKWHLGMEWPLLEQPQNGWHNFHNPRVDWSRPIKHGPTSLGFDSFFGISGSLDMTPYCYIDGDRTVGTPSETRKFYRNRIGPATPGFNPEEVLQEFGRRAVDYIGAAAKKDAPFFLYLPLNSPHTPIAPSKKFQGRSKLGPYADFVMETDWVVGQVRAALKRAGVEDNTLVIFTSDNGCSPEADFAHLKQFGHNPNYLFRGAKADIWEGGHRVPFILSWPARVKPGSVCRATICLTDFMATLAGITGRVLPPDAGEDSVSMLPLMEGRTDVPARPEVVHQSIQGSLAIRRGKWKLEFCPGSGGWSKPDNREASEKGLPKVQLYDLESDIGETTNVQDKHPALVAELTGVLQGFIDRGRSTPGKKVKNDVPVPLIFP